MNSDLIKDHAACTDSMDTSFGKLRSDHAQRVNGLEVDTKRTPLSADERVRLEAVAGVMFDIQRLSVHDGPGIRTNVFLKGCPLRCQWCANPESQNLEPDYALCAQNCMTCGQFADACPDCWDQQNGRENNGTVEIDFGARVVICPTGAMHRIGERRTAGHVLREVRRDVPFYGDGGGMTLTGGEATLQPDMAEALLRLAKAEGIHSAIETCGHTQWPVFQRLLPYLDLILYDLKHVDQAKHQAYTGLDNDLILANLQCLTAANAPLIIRIPLIPGFNADSESFEAMAAYITQLGGNAQRVDLLPYHTLGKAKYRALGRTYAWEKHKQLTEEEIESYAGILITHGLQVRIGG